MNIFVLHEDPIIAARMHCDKHAVKMPLELTQEVCDALRRHGAQDAEMPLTSKGTPWKGGYPDHPCTRWVGDSHHNFLWAVEHGLALFEEYTKRYGRRHACHDALLHMSEMDYLIPSGGLTPFARAFNGNDHLMDEQKYTAVEAYRAYYFTKRFKRGGSLVPPWWEKGTPAPSWWVNKEVKQ